MIVCTFTTVAIAKPLDNKKDFNRRKYDCFMECGKKQFKPVCAVNGRNVQVGGTYFNECSLMCVKKFCRTRGCFGLKVDNTVTPKVDPSCYGPMLKDLVIPDTPLSDEMEKLCDVC